MSTLAPKNGITMLLQAANIIENREGRRNFVDADHVYAASPSSSHRRSGNIPNSNRARKSGRRQQNRSSHNELEKNRRAHLRGCLDSLKSIVPLTRDSTRHTTLGLLNQASELIKSLERRHTYYKGERLRLQKRNEVLKLKLEKLETSIKRPRRDSTGSSWSSGRSESSNDSNDEEMVIDMTTEHVVSTTPAVASNNAATAAANKHLASLSIEQQPSSSMIMVQRAPRFDVNGTVSAARSSAPLVAAPVIAGKSKLITINLSKKSLTVVRSTTIQKKPVVTV